MLLQHATGPYDPMDQVMEDRLNAILEAAVAQDAAAIKAQFAPNAIAAQPELDDQIEALLAYYNNETWEFEIPATGISESRNETGGTTRSYEMHSRIDGEKYYLVAMHAVVNDTTEPDNVGIWSLFLLHVDVPVRERYYIKGENDMVTTCVGTPEWSGQYRNITKEQTISAKDETFIFSGLAPQPAERKCPLVPNESPFDEEKSNVRMHCAAPCLFDSFVLVLGQ